MVVEANSLKIATKTVLHDIAKHVNALAAGLQNAAPPQAGGPGKSILYLTEIGAALEEACRMVDSTSSSGLSQEL